MLESMVIFAVTGIVAGVLAGLFGVGGGLIMVPALVAVLPLQGVAQGIVMQVAIGTSLTVIAVTSLSSTRAHHRRLGVRWDVLQSLAPGLAVGALFGAFVAQGLKGHTLELIVGGGALLIALQMLRPVRSAHANPAAPAPNTIELLLVGLIIGGLSALVGIGGGSLTVPYLAYRRLPMVQAVGSAAAGGIPIAWGGARGFALTRDDLTGLPGPHLGYISVMGFVVLALFSVTTEPLGARLAHRLPAARLLQAFAALLAAVGFWLLLR